MWQGPLAEEVLESKLERLGCLLHARVDLYKFKLNTSMWCSTKCPPKLSQNSGRKSKKLDARYCVPPERGLTPQFIRESDIWEDKL